MKTTFNNTNPGIKIDDKGNVAQVTHNHSDDANTLFFLVPTREECRDEVKKQVMSIKACVAFFKSVSVNSNDLTVKSVAASVAAEDEDRMKEFEARMPAKFLLPYRR